MIRVGAPTVVALKLDLDVSSSEVAISTSFSRDDRNDGSPFSCCRGGERRLVTAALGPATGDEAEEDSGLSIMRRVRGRFSLRSGSVGGSAGDAVTERALRFRFLGLVFSSSFALSNASHALDSMGSMTGAASCN